MAGGFDRCGFDPVLLFDLLAAAQSQNFMAPCSEGVDRDGSSLAGDEEYLCGRTAASRPEGYLRTVLCIGGTSVLGVCFGPDPICRGAVQREAGEWARVRQIVLICPSNHFS